MVFGDWNCNGGSEAGLRVSFVSIRTDRRLGPALRGGDWRKSEDRGGIGASWASCGNVLGWEGYGSTARAVAAWKGSWWMSRVSGNLPPTWLFVRRGRM